MVFGSSNGTGGQVSNDGGKKTSKNTAAVSVASTENMSNGKLDWKQQKEEQAKQRKLQNQIKKCEEEIETLENRNAEIDELLAQADIYTNVKKLVELNDEKKTIEARLEELMELWESLV